jgi:hypothetical protein
MVDYIGSIWFGAGYGDRCSYPRILRYPREYVDSITYVNDVCTAVIVQMLFLVNGNDWERFHDMLA